MENQIPVRKAQWCSYIMKYLSYNRNSYSTPNRNNPSISRIGITEDGIVYDTHLYPTENMTFTDDPSTGNTWESRK